MSEADRFKYVAAYLASCHAASLESLPKSASKRERERLKSICAKAVLFLTTEQLPNNYGQPINSIIESDIERCRRASAG